MDRGVGGGCCGKSGGTSKACVDSYLSRNMALGMSFGGQSRSLWALRMKAWVPTTQGGPFLSGCLLSTHKLVISVKPLNFVGEKSLQQVANELMQISIQMAYLNKPVYV